MTTLEKLQRLTRLSNKHAVAEAAGIHANTLGFILSGKVTPSLPTLRALAAVLGVSVAWMIDDSKGWERMSRVLPVEKYFTEDKRDGSSVKETVAA